MNAHLERDDLISQDERPKTRGECGTERPCPWVSCRYHLALEVNPKTGTIKFNFGPYFDLEHMPATCALDMAEQGPCSYEELASYLNRTKQRIDQIETLALGNLREHMQHREADWRLLLVPSPGVVPPSELVGEVTSKRAWKWYRVDPEEQASSQRRTKDAPLPIGRAISLHLLTLEYDLAEGEDTTMKKGPCLDPEKMNGYCDQFGGEDYPSAPAVALPTPKPVQSEAPNVGAEVKTIQEEQPPKQAAAAVLFWEAIVAGQQRVIREAARACLQVGVGEEIARVLRNQLCWIDHPPLKQPRQWALEVFEGRQ